MSRQISIITLEKNNPVLGGAVPGQNLLSKLIRLIPSVSDPEPLFLNFENVRLATASYLREGIVYFKRHCRVAQPFIYPVVTNANKYILEDLTLALKGQNDAMVTCNLDHQNRISSIQVLGSLDSKQQFTIDVIRELGETDAISLSEKHRESENIGSTGWNNRLSALVAKGILLEVKRGRGKAYRFVLEKN